MPGQLHLKWLRAALWLCAYCRFACSQVRIVAPEWLRGKFRHAHGHVPASTATFGAPFYGDEVVGRLYWGESEQGHDHCTEDDYSIPTENEGELINIVLVRRGRCSFVTKVKVAQSKGAHAVIIVDKLDSPYTSATIDQVIMADDGFAGDDLHIPSVLISKEDGAELISAAERGEVVVELSWMVPSSDVVELDVWMSSGSMESMNFLKSFADKRRSLNTVVKFRPHYHVFSIPSGDPAIFQELCLDDTGEICAEDPDAAGEITGREVLIEDVRQLCIHDKTRSYSVSPDGMTNFQQGVSHSQAITFTEPFWKYVERLPDVCPLNSPRPHSRFGTECADRLMRSVLSSADVEEVEECMERSKEKRLKSELANVAWSSNAVRINGWRYRGLLDADLVTRAICSSFATKPPECEKLLTKRDPFAKYTGERQSVSVFSLIGGLACVVCFVCLAFLVYRRSMAIALHNSVREEVMLEVQAQLSEYKRLDL